jgi:DNA replication protein DnaC
LKPETECPVCQGNRWVLEEADGSVRARRCECQAGQRLRVLLDQARLPHRYRDCTIDGFEEHDESHKNAKKLCKKLIENFPEQHIGLLFMGGCGVGKTHLAVALIKELIEKRSARCLFYDFRELIRSLYSSFGSDSSTTESEILNPIIQADVLVLDELGARQDTPWVEEIVYYLINKRYNSKKLTIFTTNYPDVINDEEEEFQKQDFRKDIKRKETLEDRIGSRIYSKINEMCKKVILYGKDFRTYKQSGHSSRY